MYKQTGDPRIAPLSISYNTVMNAWGKCADSNAAEMAEKVLQEMLDWNKDEVKPDAITFSTLMDTYARSNSPNATHRAEDIFDMMVKLGVKRNVYTFSALQNVYARSGLHNAPEMSLQVLHRMIDLYSNGDVFAKPNCVNYNAVLNAYTRTRSKKSAEEANSMLRKMELKVEEGGFDVEPDRLSYALAILACARCPDAAFGAQLAEENLERMEERARMELMHKNEVSSAAPPSVRLDIECFNVVLTAISKSRRRDAVERTVKIIKRMGAYAKSGYEEVRPSIRSWNAVLNALSRSREKGVAEKAEQILNHLFELDESGVPNVKPDAFSFAAVLSAYQRLGTPAAVQRADDMVRRMEELYEAGSIQNPPDVYHYTIVCAAWAKSNEKRAAARCVQILSHMQGRHDAGYPMVKPNVRTYNAVLDCLARSNEEEKAEQLLYHMLALGRNGDKDAGPDSFSFNAVINAFCRSEQRDAGRRAESVLDRFLEHSEEYPSVKPDTRSFTHIIVYYARQQDMLDAPYRAEYVLNRLLSLFKSGHRRLSPDVFGFTKVMESYASHKHPDAGECAERLLRTMLKLRNDFGPEKLEVNTGVMNSVLHAWSCCGDADAGRRADLLLRDMENKFDAGDSEMRPNARSYCLVITAWAKSDSFDKAQRALEVLERMEGRYKKNKINPRTGERPCSLVINACAFTSASPDAETSVFQIAVKLMTKMLKESDYLQPVSLTYSWFIQACSRLHIPAHIRDSNIEHAFLSCCEAGMVNNFVLNRLKVAAPEPLFKRLMSPVLLSLPKHERDKGDLKQRISLSHLPKSWTRKPNRRKEEADVSV